MLLQISPNSVHLLTSTHRNNKAASAKAKPKPATAAANTSTNAARGSGGRRGRGRGGRGNGGRKPKTAEELDAEMVDYFDAPAGGDAAGASTTNGTAPAPAAGGDTGMEDEIMVGFTTCTTRGRSLTSRSNLAVDRRIRL